MIRIYTSYPTGFDPTILFCLPFQNVLEYVKCIQYVVVTYAFAFLNHTLHIGTLKMFWERKFEIFTMMPISKNLVKKWRKEENKKPKIAVFHE